MEVSRSFTGWLERAGYASYDPYDVWGTGYGLWARGMYYRRGVLGIPLVAPILLLETLWPRGRGAFVEKKRYATADAQLLLAFLNLRHASGEGAFLEKALRLGEELLGYSIPGYGGPCWGYPFDWRHNRGLWRKNTPFITCTPYVFEAFLGLHDVTGETRHLETAAAIARFVHDDLKDTPTGPDAAAASYSPGDATKVINASAYRAFVLFEAAHRCGATTYREKARRNLNFILQNQREDGSWLYAVDNPAEQFIDHFHTCFVLKNLHKINRRLRDAALESAIQRGWAFYRRALFDADDNPVSFAIKPRTQLVSLEMYDVAEAITLGALLKDEAPGALALAHTLARRVRERWQLRDGHFITRAYRGGLRHTLPFLRWSQAQVFYSITNLLVATSNQGGDTA